MNASLGQAIWNLIWISKVAQTFTLCATLLVLGACSNHPRPRAGPPTPGCPADTHESSENCTAWSAEKFPELAARVRDQFGERCQLERVCGDLAGINCDSEVDGPYDYVESDTLDLVSECGGACMGAPCSDCPPDDWTCKVY